MRSSASSRSSGASFLFSATIMSWSRFWRMPAGGGASIQLTKRGGSWPAASRDGESVYFARGTEVWKIPAPGGEEKLVQIGVTSQVATAAAADWVAVPGGLYFLSRDHSGAVLKFLNFRTRRESRVIPVEKPWDLAPMTASPDGKFLLFAQRDHGGADLMVAENFR